MLMNKLVINWWHYSNKWVRGQLVPPERSNPLGEWQQCPDGCLAAVLFRIMSRQLRETEIQDKLMFTFMDYCSYCSTARRSQQGLGAVAVLSPPQAADNTDNDNFGLTGSHGWNPLSLRVIECLVLCRYLGNVQPWHAQEKVTVPLHGGQSKKNRFILTHNPILPEKNTSEHAELWFWVVGTKEDESSKMRQLSWRTQQGCVGWVLKCSPTLQKSLTVP